MEKLSNKLFFIKNILFGIVICFKDLFLNGLWKSTGREEVQELVMERDCK